MKTLVTGSSGVFGPYLVRELVSHGHEVVLFSRRKPTEEFSGLEWIPGDINNVSDCINAIEGRGFDAIHNLAAMADPTDIPPFKGYDDPALFPRVMQTNIIGLYNMLEVANRSGVNIFINTGTNCVLGHGYRSKNREPIELKYLPIDEDHPSQVEDSYSLSKIIGEMILEKYSRVSGMRCYSLRPASIFNEKQRVEWVNKKWPTGGWDEWLFAWTASEDLANAHRLLMEQAYSIIPYGCYYCMNNDTNASEPTKDIINKYRPDLISLIKEPLVGRASLFSSKRLKAVVGWEPKLLLKG